MADTYAVRLQSKGVWYTASTWGTKKKADSEADRMRRLHGRKEAKVELSRNTYAPLEHHK